MIMESWEIRMLRGQAWERAKGELNAMMVTYGATSNDHLSSGSWEKFKEFERLFTEFVQRVENEALNEPIVNDLQNDLNQKLENLTGGEFKFIRKPEGKEVSLNAKDHAETKKR